MTMKYLGIILTASLLAACDGNDTPPAPAICGEQSSRTLTLSGQATYDFIPNTDGGALDYNATEERAIRGATVSLVRNNSVIESTTSDDNGNFSFSAPQNQILAVRVSAALKQTGSPSWDIRVTDNTSDNALYVMEGDMVCTGTTNQERDLHAPSGWTGDSYGNPRTAAPFAILDSIYEALVLLLDSDPLITLPPVELRWSTQNRAIPGDNPIGNIGTSHYLNSVIHILGDENDDTDEYDRSVIQHEFAHYLEDTISRTDSVGGPHRTTYAADMRLAFSEGLANAFAGMASGSEVYSDSNAFQQSGGFEIWLEADRVNNRGWYSENSSGLILYDIFDSNDDGSDAISLGFRPIYDTLVSNAYRAGNARMSIYSFAHTLRDILPSNDAAGVTDLLAEQNIFGVDAFGTGETNDDGQSIILPIYHELAVGSTINLCSSTYGGTINSTGISLPNGVGVTRFATFDISNSGNYRFEAERTSSNGGRETDPDIIIYQNANTVTRFESSDINSEGGIAALPAGSYVLEFYDYYNTDDAGLSGLACFDLSLTSGS